jgi:hypothetical protein
VKSLPPHSSYPLVWNGIRFSIPLSWEPIVKGNSHFIFESGLKPVLEIRWENAVKNDPEESLAAVFSELSKKKAEPPIRVKPPVFLANISGQFRLSCYGRANLAQPEGACIVCKECGTIILVHFFPDLLGHSDELSTIFQGLDCHHQMKHHPWTILDITFRPPESFELDRFSFDYGMSRIEFKNKTSALTLYRLAPASKHLEGSSLGTLFSVFSQTGPDSHQSNDRYTVVHSNRPGLGARLLSYIGKKQPYTWSRFTHVKQADRILGICLKSSLPLIQDHIDTIRDSYEIIQE